MELGNRDVYRVVGIVSASVAIALGGCAIGDKIPEPKVSCAEYTDFGRTPGRTRQEIIDYMAEHSSDDSIFRCRDENGNMLELQNNIG